MITAVDSSALFSILKGEPDAEKWISLLIKYAAVGDLCVCDVVASELGGYFPTLDKMRKFFDRLTIRIDALNDEACHIAGKIFRLYRESGGRRESIIPDFMIGAHALVQANALIASDRGYLRTYFKDLKVISGK